MNHKKLIGGLCLAAMLAGCDTSAVSTPEHASTNSAAQAAAAGMSHGEYVARLGNCVACHSISGGDALAGGLKMNVPMLGDIYTTNITPDPVHGIGDWTFEDFDRSMRVGVTKDGTRMYPAMPYTSYAKMSEQDMRALYDFIMNEVPASSTPNPENEIPGWKDARWALGIWNVLVHDDSPYEPQSDQGEDWNRGAYLIQGLGHCGACHTPRGLMMQEKALDESGKHFLAGAELDHWYASSLNGDINSGLGRLSAEDIAEFLKTGRHRLGTAFGTMVEVINNSTTFMSDDDLMAMGTYLKTLPALRDESPAWEYVSGDAEQLASLNFEKTGSQVYYEYCSSCHALDGNGYYPYQAPLAGNPVVMDPNPVSLINLTLNASLRLVTVDGPATTDMPHFNQLLSDQEIADSITFIRNAWGNRGSSVSASEVATVREATDPHSDEIITLRMK